MAGDIYWKAPTVALASYLTTSLNALGNGVIDIGAAINNETNLCLYMDLEVHLASADFSAMSSPRIDIYMFESVDGGSVYDTNEDAVSAATDIPTGDKLLCTMGFRVDTGAEAKHMVRSMIPIPPGYFKLGLLNSTGMALAATGNTLQYRTYRMQYS